MIDCVLRIVALVVTVAAGLAVAFLFGWFAHGCWVHP